MDVSCELLSIECENPEPVTAVLPDQRNQNALSVLKYFGAQIKMSPNTHVLDKSFVGNWVVLRCSLMTLVAVWSYFCIINLKKKKKLMQTRFISLSAFGNR